MTEMEFIVEVAQPEHEKYAEAICNEMRESAKARGTGIAERKPEYIVKKIQEGKAVIALQGDTFAGFCTRAQSWRPSQTTISQRLATIRLRQPTARFMSRISRRRQLAARLLALPGPCRSPLNFNLSMIVWKSSRHARSRAIDGRDVDCRFAQRHRRRGVPRGRRAEHALRISG